jgi:hypothetical protein
VTPEERAEKIAWQAVAYKDAADKIVAVSDIAHMVAAEIRAAVEDRAADDVRRCEKLLVKARAEAYEDAAKIADLLPGNNGRQAAKAIRALKSGDSLQAADALANAVKAFHELDMLSDDEKEYEAMINALAAYEKVRNAT